MPGQHKGHPTIAFRPSTWQKAIIEERAALSGMRKKDFIARSCVYSHIVVVGKKENIQRIVDELQEMQNVMLDIAGMIMSGEFPLSEESFQDMKEKYLALAVTVVDIVNGAAYIFDKKAPDGEQKWKESLEVEQYRHALKLDIVGNDDKEESGGCR